MRILILATARSGSTTLARGISRTLGIKVFYEPFNTFHPDIISINYKDELPKDCVVKTIMSQVPENYEGDDFYSEYMERLSRQDIPAAYESYIHNLTKNPKGDWHQQYIYDKSIKYNNRIHSYMWDISHKIYNFSIHNEIPMTWYEDLYSGKTRLVNRTINKWNLDIDSKKLRDFLNPKFKYRKTPEKNRLI